MKTILTFSFFIMAWIGTITAQTKLIAHKSHSGSNENFKIALTHDLFDLGHSNFGMAPQPLIESARLDSLIFISDSISIMITSNVCSRRRSRKHSVWSAGRDTVYLHPLFKHQHSKDSIKTVLDSLYNFKNPSDSVAFIGYDNIKPIIEIKAPVVEKKEVQKEDPVFVKPSKKQTRKAKKALKRKKKKAKKEKERQVKQKPVIKPAAFIPVTINDPKDPPGFSVPLKAALIGLVGFLAIITGFLAKRMRTISSTKLA